VEAIPDYLEKKAIFLTMGVVPQGYSSVQKKQLVIKATDYQLIARQLYKLGIDRIIRRCVVTHEHLGILWERHSGVAGGHYGGKEMAQKVLWVELWWPTVFKDAKEYAKSCDVCHRMGRDPLGDMNCFYTQWLCYRPLINRQ